MASYNLQSGVRSEGLVLIDADRLYVNNGGSAYQTTIESGASALVYPGGMTDYTK